jgi:hypothetical protein
MFYLIAWLLLSFIVAVAIGKMIRFGMGEEDD